jgi:GNAT superfamily N-acetyltransferase
VEWCISPLRTTGCTRSSLKKTLFDCGNTPGRNELNKYLKQLAWKNDEIGIAKTFVVHSQEDNKQIVAYYSISMSLIEAVDLPDTQREGLPGYPVPAMLIGKLAVDKSLQRQGIGKLMLAHIFCSVIEIAEKVGVFAVKIEAKDDEAAEYYVNRGGFIRLKNTPLRLFLPVSTIRRAREIEGLGR